jgi:predicted permease
VVSPRVDALHDQFVSDFQVMGKVLGASVVLVLLIACANVASAMLARSTFRQRELAIRMALGASAKRVGRQMLTEAIALATVAGVLGTVVAAVAIRGLVLSAADRLPRWVVLELGPRAVVFSVMVVAITALLFGLVPALQARRQDVRDCLALATPRSSASRQQRRLLDALVVVEIALASVLLVAGGLLTRTYSKLYDTQPGFAVDGIATFRVVLPQATYRNGIAQRAFYERLLEQVRALPGVATAGAVHCPPLTCHRGNFFEAEGGTPRGPDGTNPVVLTLGATPGYLEAIGAGLAHGHFFREGEGAPTGFRATVVNESFAKRMWPSLDDPTGKRFRFAGDTASDRWMTVVGVMKDMRHYGLDKPPRPTVIYSSTGVDSTIDIPSLAVIARTTGDPSQLFAPMRALVRAMDPELPVFDVRTMQQALDESLRLRRMLTLALGAFAGIALTLAVGGIYAVLSYVVGRRRREIGIRMALGAQRGQVVGAVVRQGTGLVLVGLVIGLPIALGGSRLLSSALVGVTARDPLTYLAVAAVLLATGILAALVPARRASTVDPTVTLAEGM